MFCYRSKQKVLCLKTEDLGRQKGSGGKKEINESAGNGKNHQKTENQRDDPRNVILHRHSLL